MLLVRITLFMILTRRSELSEDKIVEVPHTLLKKQGAVSFYQDKVHTYTAMVYDDVNDYLIVGATNNLFVLKYTRTALKKIDQDELTPSHEEVEYCIEREGNETRCHQYGVKWLHIKDRELYICGAKAFTPSCEVRSLINIKIKTKENLDVENKAPRSPSTKTAYHVVNNKVYAGITIDVDGTLGGIILSDLADPYFNPVRTVIPKDKDDTAALSWMYFPEFVGSFEEGEFVYFVFREVPLENPVSQESGVVYSRIGRVCKNDRGGRSGDMAGIMVSFLKATITCPDYDIVQGMYYDAGKKVLYTSFTNQLMDGSGICWFELSAIEMAFYGRFKYRKSDSEPWMDVEPTNTEGSNETKVDTCFGTRTMFDAKNLHLMADVIAPSCGKPVYQLKKIYFSAIYVSPSKSGEPQPRDSLTGYFGDSQGNIWTFSLRGCDKSLPIEIWHAAPKNDSPINSIIVLNEIMHVLSYSGVTAIPFHRISAHPTPGHEPIEVYDNEEAEDDYEIDLNVHKKVTPPFIWPKSNQKKQIAAVRSHGINSFHPDQVMLVLSIMSSSQARFKVGH